MLGARYKMLSGTNEEPRSRHNEASKGFRMRMTDADFEAPIFTDHSPGWQTPSDIVAGFTLAWALELKERMRISPFQPDAEGVRELLPAKYQFDTLGRLITLDPTASIAEFGRNSLIRLSSLCGAWQLFDLMNQTWRIKPGDFQQFSDLLAFVTGGRDRPSLYRDLSANIGKCLLAVRVRRACSGEDELDLAEEWFLTGNEDLTFVDEYGSGSLLFHFSNLNQAPLRLFSHEFVNTVWATARVTVDQLGPDRVIAIHSDRADSLLDLLERGAEKATKARQEMSWQSFQWFDYWPGWR